MSVCIPTGSIKCVIGFVALNPSKKFLVPMALCQMAFEKVVKGWFFNVAAGTLGLILLILLHLLFDLAVQLIHRVQDKVKLG